MNDQSFLTSVYNLLNRPDSVGAWLSWIILLGLMFFLGEIILQIGSQIAVTTVDSRTKNPILRILGYYIFESMFASGLPVPCCFFLIPPYVFSMTPLYSALTMFIYLTIQIIITKIYFIYNPTVYKNLIDPDRECMLDYTYIGCIMRGDKDYIKKFYFPDEEYIKNHPITKKDISRFPS